MTQALFLSACFIFTMDRMREIDYPLSSGGEKSPSSKGGVYPAAWGKNGTNRKRVDR